MKEVVSKIRNIVISEFWKYLVIVEPQASNTYIYERDNSLVLYNGKRYVE